MTRDRLRPPRSSGHGRRPKPFGLHTLRDYLHPECDPNMVVMDLHRNIYEFMAFLENENLAQFQYGRFVDEKLAVVVQVLAERVCAEGVVLKSKQETILKVVVDSENFRNKIRFKCDCLKATEPCTGVLSLDETIRNSLTSSLKKFLSNFTAFLKEILKTKTNFSMLEVVRADAEEMLKKLLTESDEDFQVIFEKLAGLSLIPREDSDDENSADNGGADDSKEDGQSSVSVPAREFRNLPIFPTVSELLTEEVGALEANIVSGSYENAEHYLDVQFRLLREDFVRPLREGMRDLVKNLPDYQKAYRKQGANIKVYYDVQVENVNSDRGVMVYDMVLDDDVELDININGECKNFMTGGLLVLSNDNFKTLYLATVHKFEAKDRSVGVTFYTDISIDGEVLRKQLFIMVEYEIFFEAYRHTLEVLKSLEISEMRFARYIVSGASDVNPPEYIEKNLGMMKIHGNFINVLREGGWASVESDMKNKYDQKQYEAYKACVTKEFTIVQGPPGTGKTFLGVHFMESLLDNLNAWKGIGTDQGGPILIVCYTNHALDQFLEGIVKLFESRSEHPSIVRIGGACKSEKLQPYMFHNYRNDNMDRLPKNYQPMKNSAYSAVRAAEEKFDSYSAILNDFDACDIVNLRYILGGILLQPEVSSQHRDYIEKMTNVHWFGYESQKSEYSCKTEDLAKMFPGSDFSGTQVKSGDLDTTLSPFSVFRSKFEKCQQRIQGSDNQAGKKRDLERLEKYNSFIKHSRVILQCWNQGKLQLHQLSSSSDSSVRDESNISFRWAKYFEVVVEVKNLIKRKMDGMRYHIASARKSLQEILNYGDGMLLSQLTVVGMTTTGAAKYNALLKVAKPRIVIVEEAAEVLEPHLVACLLPSVQQVTLIGDHQQLRPGTAVHELAAKYKLDVSLFERMVNNSITCHRLNVQHRMRPEISNLITGTIYPDLKNAESVKNRPHVKGMDTDLYFFAHTELEEKSSAPSRSNSFEVNIIINFYKYLLLQGYTPDKITILCTYAQQVAVFEERLKKKGIFCFQTDEDSAEYELGAICGNPAEVTVSSVDGYQGKENEIIILSLVRSNEEGRIGFLSIENRICVALSRARNGLYIFGNMNQLRNQSDVWKVIYDKLDFEDRVGDALPLKCEAHGNTRLVKSPSDFTYSAPAGGCLELCGKSLSCGHKCNKFCHAIFPYHEAADFDYEEEHGPAPNYSCLVPVEIKLLNCNHKKEVECWESKDLEKFICEEIVKLKCGHTVECCKKEIPCKLCEVGMRGHIKYNSSDDDNGDSDDHHSNVLQNQNTFKNPKRGYPKSVYRQCVHPSIVISSPKPVCDQRCGMELQCGHPCRNLCCDQICGPCVVAGCIYHVNRAPSELNVSPEILLN